MATVGQHKITAAELDAAHRRQIDMLRRPDAWQRRRQALRYTSGAASTRSTEWCVEQVLLQVAGDKAGYVTTDDRLLREYMTDRQFDTFRRPDGSLDVEGP